MGVLCQRTQSFPHCYEWFGWPVYVCLHTWSLRFVFFLLQFPLPAESDHSTMLNKVVDFPYVLPDTFSSALISLLTEVCKRHPVLSNLHSMILLMCHTYLLICLISLHRCSFCARIQRTGFVTWTLSRCRPSFAALRSTRSCFRRRLSTSSSSSGLIPTGQPKRGEVFHWTALITLTVISSFVLPLIPLNCLPL